MARVNQDNSRMIETKLRVMFLLNLSRLSVWLCSQSYAFIINQQFVDHHILDLKNWQEHAGNVH